MSIKLLAAPIVEASLLNLKKECDQLKKNGVTPKLHVILVGDHKPSLIYTRNKKKFCEKFDADCDIIKLDKEVTKQDFLDSINKSNTDDSVHGVIVQLPLPDQLKDLNIGHLVNPEKDVDGFHPENMYQLMKGYFDESHFISCTPKGILSILDFYKIPISKKKVVIIGRSMIVGRPLSMLLTSKDATVTLCHSQTPNLEEYTKAADIIISATGQSGLIQSKHIGDNTPVVIDVGISRNKDGRICGDIIFDEVQDKCSAISPVPGGVGPMTILSLAQNLIIASKRSLQKK